MLQACRSKDRILQRKVYEYLSPRLYLTCKRYLQQEADIDDALTETFFILFTKSDQLKTVEAFEGWVKKIAVNQCLALIRKRPESQSWDDENVLMPIPHSAPDKMDSKDLLQLLRYLPEKCRAVFNLFAIEGYSHKEIAALLQVSEGTSKSQLNYARTRMQDLVQKYYYSKAK